MTTKFRISISSSNSGSRTSTPVDFADFAEFIEYLEDNGISKISLKYFDIIDDSPNWRNDGAGINIENITADHFEWLSTRIPGESRFLEIDSKNKKPCILKRNMLHEKLMPFKEKQILKYFDNKNHLDYFKNSLVNYKKYTDQGKDCPVSDFRELRQAEKDERFYTTRTFINLFEREVGDRNNILKLLLSKAFGEKPPFEKNIKYPKDWSNFLNGNLELSLEHVGAAPKEYKEFLSTNLEKRHFVKYVLEAGKNKDKSSLFRLDLEGSTHVDAFIENKSSGFKIYVEAKFLSDISCDVSYDVTRNQLARNIDVMLEDKNGRSLFLLITPGFFKNNPYTRLYGYKMKDYLSNHLTLMADLCHRKNIEPYEWKLITERIAWITWEDLTELGI